MILLPTLCIAIIADHFDDDNGSRCEQINSSREVKKFQPERSFLAVLLFLGFCPENTTFQIRIIIFGDLREPIFPLTTA